jgi:AbrB family looped-hinge helix DNA binding protein
MISKITSKYQTTVPKRIRDKLKLHVADSLEWKIEDDKVVVFPAGKKFLKYHSIIKVGTGNIKEDIEKARDSIIEKYK